MKSYYANALNFLYVMKRWAEKGVGNYDGTIISISDTILACETAVHAIRDFEKAWDEEQKHLTEIKEGESLTSKACRE